MPQISQLSTSDSKVTDRLAAAVYRLGTLLCLSLIAIPVGHFLELVDSRSDIYGVPTPTDYWYALALVGAASLGALYLLQILTSTEKPLGWVRNYLGFLVVSYWLMAVYMSGLDAAQASIGGLWIWRPLNEVVMSCLVVSLAWLAIFGRKALRLVALSFGLSLFAFVAVLGLTEPDLVQLMLARVGLVEPVRSALISESLPWLPFASAVPMTLVAATRS